MSVITINRTGIEILKCPICKKQPEFNGYYNFCVAIWCKKHPISAGLSKNLKQKECILTWNKKVNYLNKVLSIK